ncbi:MAG: DUF4301 family protein [Candidatus Izemoplasmatales bacterium]
MKQFIDKFEKGTQYVQIVSSVNSDDLHDDSDLSLDYLSKDCIKFIPASGAATRMFKDLYQYLNEQRETDFIKTFFDYLEDFAFYHDIKELDYDKTRLGDRVEMIYSILKDKLKYGSLPKALIKMHAYDQEISTPIDEHIYEGEQYLNKDKVRLHFTISKEHEDLFNAYIKPILKQKPYLSIEYSFQKDKTNTLAVDMENNPFILEDGSYLYRAGGHGSLIENLNDIEADIIFIKNIDNVVHRDHVEDTIESKRKLASIGLKIKEQIDAYIMALNNDEYDLNEIELFLRKKLHIKHKKDLTKAMALAFLNRPLRVCGMVKNTGEPGGGPFVVDHGDYTDLQICEKSEINLNDPRSLHILNSSSYFNPVDLVCFVKDYKNQKFNLLDFVEEDRYFISEKSYHGKAIKALEHPGLWNGAMHHWNSVFVEVSLSTFNPVKTVNDLLRQGHQKK